MPLAALPAPRDLLSTSLSVLVARSMSVYAALPPPRSTALGQGVEMCLQAQKRVARLRNLIKTTDLFLAVQINSSCSSTLDSACTCAGNGPSLRKGWGEEQAMHSYNIPQTLPLVSHF